MYTIVATASKYKSFQASPEESLNQSASSATATRIAHVIALKVANVHNIFCSAEPFVCGASHKKILSSAKRSYRKNIFYKLNHYETLKFGGHITYFIVSYKNKRSSSHARE